MEDAIVVENVSKTFALHHTVVRNLKERVLGLFITRLRRNVEMFSALKNISLRIPTGSCVGFIGHNGSGKSTLLSVIAGIYAPTTGSLKIAKNSRIGTLIQLGVGFCPELSGRENIFLNASLYGFSNRQTCKLYHKIVEFSELAHFIDTPLKNYSSGMYARLGFSVTVHLNLDILLIDEILGVGDSAFQDKCFTRMQELKKEGRTMLFVSHDTGAVSRFCDQVCLLHGGELLGIGKPDVVLEVYDKLIHGNIDANEARASLKAA